MTGGAKVSGAIFHNMDSVLDNGSQRGDRRLELRRHLSQ
jgi:hypothetical protein